MFFLLELKLSNTTQKCLWELQDTKIFCWKGQGGCFVHHLRMHLTVNFSLSNTTWSAKTEQSSGKLAHLQLLQAVPLLSCSWVILWVSWSVWYPCRSQRVTTEGNFKKKIWISPPVSKNETCRQDESIFSIITCWNSSEMPSACKYV